MFHCHPCIFPCVFLNLWSQERVRTLLKDEFWSNLARFGSRNGILTKWHNDSASFLPEKLKKHVILIKNFNIWPKYGPLWAHMAPYGPLWAPYGLIWAPYGPIWTHMGPYGPTWAHMGPYAPYGSRWAPYGSHMGPYEPIWAHMGPYGPMWALMGPYRPSWTGLGGLGSFRILSVNFP